MNGGIWRVEMFGALVARQGNTAISRFRSQKTALLFAYLACFRDRPHSRELLVETFWPDSEPAQGRTSLRTSLASLRRQLEPPGIPFGTVLLADAASVQLNPRATDTDVAEFLDRLSAAATAQAEDRRLELLEAAVQCYRGELLPGFYAEWVEIERRRLLEAYFDALKSLTRAYTVKRDYERALAAARKTLDADPLREDSHRDLMRLYAAMGRPSAALAQFAEMEKLVRLHLGGDPSPASQELARRISSAAQLPRAAGISPPPAPETLDPSASAPAEPVQNIKPPVLPIALSRFFGRTTELAELTGALAPNGRDGASRLFTLTGPGGVGKTRTAIETARTLRDAYAGRVWYVPLADTLSVDQVAGAIAATLSVKAAGASAVVEEVAAVLGAHPSLLVLDNFEQVAEKAPSVVSALLARARPLKTLVTSRRRLALDGEREVPLGPLAIPREEDDPESLLAIPSVQLFVDRAQAVLPDFQLTPGNAPSVARICRILEGIPLAIELAAARSQAMTPSRMVERLSERFQVLSALRDDRVARHRSLWAAIDWSYRLLSPDLQRFFRALSVFRGGCTEEAAAAVCEEPFALEYLTHLRVHSLLQTSPVAAEMRFLMLETIREFAAEQLEKDGKDYRERHARYYGSLAESAGPHLAGPEQASWLERLDAEDANLREALRTMLNPDFGESSLRLALALWRFWWIRGRTEEASYWLEKSLDVARSPLLRAEALQDLGNLAWRKGDSEQALAFYQEALSLRESSGNRHGQARSLGSIGNACRALGRAPEARNAYEQSLAIFREIEDEQGIATSLLNLGTLAEDRDDLDSAYTFYADSLQIYRRLGDLHSEGLTLCNLADICANKGLSGEAREFIVHSLRIARALNDYPRIGALLGVSAKLALQQGHPQIAAELIGAAGQFHLQHGLPLTDAYQAELDRIAERVRESLPAEDYGPAVESGKSLAVETAFERALGLPAPGSDGS